MLTKRCGKCGRELPLATRVGNHCPYCGVQFGYQSQAPGLRRSPDRTLVWVVFWVLVIVAVVSFPRIILKHRMAEQARHKQADGTTGPAAQPTGGGSQ